MYARRIIDLTAAEQFVATRLNRNSEIKTNEIVLN